MKKSLKLIPHLSKSISDIATMIETQLPRQVKHSDILFSAFINKTQQTEKKLQAMLELNNRDVSQGASSEQAADVPSKKSNLTARIEQILGKMTRGLKLSHECLVVANLYMQRAIAMMRSKSFYLSSATAEK
jgi:hypothetical protein